MATQIQVRRDVASSWSSVNPTLAQGEPGYEEDTGKLKFGDGSTPWGTLGYFAGGGGGGGSGLNGWLDVTAAPYNAVGNGTADDTTAIANAITAAQVTGGVVYFPPGKTFKYTTQFNVTSPKVWLVCGPGVTFLPTGCSGIKWNLGPFSGVPITSGGIFGYPVIDGTSAGSGALGLEYGDAVDGRVELVVQNFSGSTAKGIYVNNVHNYTEGTWWDVVVSNCKTCMVFDVQSGAASNSHGYLSVKRARFNNINSGQTGLSVINAALLYNGEFNFLGNLATGGTFMSIVGNSGANGFPTGTSGLVGQLDIRAEQTTGTPGSATGIAISNYGQLQGSGFVDMSSGLLASSIASGNGLFTVAGKVQVPGIGWNGEVPSFIGGTSWGAHGGTTPAYTNSWVQNGTPVSFGQDATGWVCLEGSVKSGTASTSAFTLPVGYRPPVARAFGVPTTSGFGVVAVNSDGTVVCPNSSYTSLDGIRFKPVQG